jgi:hypothetical protein
MEISVEFVYNMTVQNIANQGFVQPLARPGRAESGQVRESKKLSNPITVFHSTSVDTSD